MAKVRVQDATRDLSTNSGKILESLTRLRTQSQDVLGSLRKISDGFAREEKERQERQAKEELQKQYAAAAQYMTAYSSENAPEVPSVSVQAEVTPAPKAEEKPAPKAEEKPAPKAEEKPAPKAEEKPAPKAEEKSAPKAEEKPASKAEEKPASKGENKSASKPEKNAKSENKSAPKAEKNAKSENKSGKGENKSGNKNGKSENKGSAKPENKNAPKAEDKPAPKAEEKPAPKAEEKPAPNAEEKPAPKAEEKPAPKAEEKSAPKAEEKPAPKAEEKPIGVVKSKLPEGFVSPIRVIRAAPVQKPAESQPQQNTQQRYGRPANPAGQNGEQGQGQRYGRPANPAGRNGEQGQQRYGRPVNPAGQNGEQGQGQRYGRPVNSAEQNGEQGQRYGRPANPAGRNGEQGQGQRPFNRPAGGQGGQRSGGGNASSRGGSGSSGFGRGSKMSDLAPAVEKERVSNYDPNKKQYIRQIDPERNANKPRRKDTVISTGYDDEIVRGKRKKKSAQQEVARPEPVKIEKAYMTADTITVRDLTERIGKPAGEIIKKLMMLGIIATINNELDFDTAQLVASEFGVELEMKLAATAEDALENENTEDVEENLQTRPPVVTIMGHVDHGKTSLLDYIRHAHVTASEAGGITQHIGAYTVDLDGQKITFLDTPGHEAFTAMRLRGAQATDIAVLVVAADDGVMPQTIEAINHAKAAGVQTIVAINKMDKPAANPDRIMQQLTEYDLVAEEWGGDTIMVPVSAMTGEGVDRLLEMILLVAEVQDYRANPDRKARGIIIEARLDKGRGPVATVLVKNGTLNVGDTIVAGTAYGRVRAMTNDRGDRVKSAGPSVPVEVIGFNDVPEAGDTINAVDDDKLSRQVAEERKDKARAALIKAQQKTTLDDLFSQISAGQIKDLNIIVKADVQGSVEAVKQSLEKLSNDEVRVRTIHGGVGAITETDIMLASASNAIVIGFNVRPDSNARDLAEHEKIDVRLYRVIYSAIEDVEKAMKGMLAPKFKEVLLGHAEVRQTFHVSGVGTIAGAYVTDGKIARNASIRLLRDNVVVHEGKIDSLKRFKDDAKEVNSGYECGIGIENYNDVKEGDVIECFQMEEIEQ